MTHRLPDFRAEAAAEHERLGRVGAQRILADAREWARGWDLPSVLLSGGALIFPHIGLERCGLHTAAVVHAVLDACAAGGAKRVLLLGVLHALTEELEEARRRVAAGGDPTTEPAWGIQGPGMVRDRTADSAQPRRDWEREFSLLDFLFLWEIEVERRDVASEEDHSDAPELIVRYPYLAGGHPERLPGVGELSALFAGVSRGAESERSTLLVATADPFHHGIGYGDRREQARAPEQGGLDLARRRIEEGLAILRTGDHWAYNRHCVDAKSDARDVGQLLRYLLGPVEGEILDLAWADTAADYGKPAPTWVAGALIALRPIPI